MVFKLNDELTVEYRGLEDMCNGIVKIKYILNGEPIDFNIEIEELEKLLAKPING